MNRCDGLDNVASTTIAMIRMSGCMRKGSPDQLGRSKRAIAMESAERTAAASAYASPRFMNSRKSISRCLIIACATRATNTKLKYGPSELWVERSEEHTSELQSHSDLV